MQDLNKQEKGYMSADTQRTVLPPSKKHVKERNKHPPCVSETQQNNLKENGHRSVTKSSSRTSEMVQQHMAVAVTQANTKLVSSENVDQRIVIPRISPDVVANQSSRTVVPPQNQSKSAMITCDSSCKKNSSTVPTANESSSTNAVKSQKYLDYLEEMELKIRYMKNDIEFKKSQIHTNDKAVNNYSLNSISNKALIKKSFSASYKNVDNTSIVPSSRSHTASSSMYQVKKINSGGQNVDLFHLSKKSKINPTSSHSKESCVSQVPTQTVTSFSLNRSSDIFHFKASNSNRTIIPKAVLTAGSLNKYEEPVSVGNNQMSSNVGPKLTQSTLAPNAPSIKRLNAMVFSSTNNISMACNQHKSVVPASSEVKTDNSASLSMKNSSALQQTRPDSVHTSSDIRSVVLPGNKASIPLPSSSALENEELSLQKQSTSNSKSAIIHETPGSSNQTQYFTNAQQPTDSTQAKTAFSTRFKLVKTLDKTSSALKKTMLNSNDALSHSSAIHPYKYLRPKSSIKPRRSSFGSKNIHRTVPQLKVQTAAKVVSKYKLKRLSPTTAPKIAPYFCQTSSTSQNSVLQSDEQTGKLAPGNVKASISPHKLDRRATSTSSSNSGVTNLYKNKLRLGTRSDLSPSQHTSRLQNRSKLKLDKRGNRPIASPSFLRRQEGHEKVHKVNKSNFPVGITNNPRKLTLRRRSKHHWVRDKTDVPGNGGIPRPKSSQFRWSRPSVQAANTDRRYSKQNLRLLFGRQQRHSRRNSGRAVHSGITASRSSHLVMIGGVVYRSSSRKLVRTRELPSSQIPPGNSAVEQTALRQKKFGSLKNGLTQNTKLISLRGVHYHLDHSGKRLCRTAFDTNKASTSAACSSGSAASSSSTSHLHSRSLLSERGFDDKTRLAASRAVHRSIAIATAKFIRDNRKRKQNKLHCVFFGRFGKCQRGRDCPFIHDPEKVAVCTRFLRGKCDGTNCPFSHKASVHKMPVCLFYLRGSCSREDCPYLHVKVNPDAPLCKDFRNGFCPLGEKCKKMHSWVCPAYAATGTCSRGERCLMLHRKRKKVASQTVPSRIGNKTRSIQQPTSEDSGQSLSSTQIFFTPVSSKPLSAQPSFISLVGTPTDNKTQKPSPPLLQHLPNIRPVFAAQADQISSEFQDSGNTAKDEMPLSLSVPQEPLTSLRVASKIVPSQISAQNHVDMANIHEVVMTQIEVSCAESVKSRVATDNYSTPRTQQQSFSTFVYTNSPDDSNGDQCKTLASHSESMAQNDTGIFPFTSSVPIPSSHSSLAAPIQETIAIKDNDMQGGIASDYSSSQVIFYPHKCLANSVKANSYTNMAPLAAQPSFISLATQSHGSQSQTECSKLEHQQGDNEISSATSVILTGKETPKSDIDIRPIFLSTEDHTKQ